MNDEDALHTPVKKAKPVVQTRLDGTVEKIWPSMKAASLELGINLPSIWKCCQGELNKTNGFTWKYYEGE